MTFVHVGLLILGIVLGVGVADLAAHRGVPSWPLIPAVMGTVVLAGYLYSAPLAAFSLGLAIAVCLVAGGRWVRTMLRLRTARHGSRALRSRARGDR